jgi:hypothetical protein
MFKNYFLLLSLFAGVIMFSSCDDDPVIPNEEELITTVNYTLTSTAGDVVTLQFLDLDGDGGNAPVITGGTLTANTSYSGSMELLNESEDPSEDVTEEIMEEDDEHQFFFATTVAGLTVDYADTDGNSDPVGLASTVTTGDAGSGTLTVILRHEPDKGASGVSDGDITNAGGSTELEATFPIDVQ